MARVKSSTSQKSIKFFMEHRAFQLGEFELKSRRVSPYFFNTGCLNTGETISTLSSLYAEVVISIIEDGTHVDNLFGPAYKGTFLAPAVAQKMWEAYRIDVSYTSDRKETKDHGDKGDFVGAEITGNVIILDDVVTNAATKIEAINYVHSKGGRAVALLIAFDRNERVGSVGTASAVQKLEEDFSIPVYPLTTIAEAVAEMRSGEHASQIPAIEEYLARYAPLQR